jgi:hypothetical protein
MPDPRWNAYLGDGLYAEFDGYQVRLWASDGVRCTNEVFLDGTTMTTFEGWLAGLRVPAKGGADD